METKSEQKLFVTQHKKIFSWVLYATCFLGIGGILLVTAILGKLIAELMVDPKVNLLMLLGGMLCSLPLWWSLFSDAKKMAKGIGVGFSLEFFYLYRPIDKLKLPYDQIQYVQFFPALVNLSRGDNGSRSWMRVKTQKRSYFLVTPRYKEVIAELESLHIPVKINRVALPIFIVSIMLARVTHLDLVYSLAFIGCMIFKRVSRHGFLSRSTELALLASFVGAVLWATCMQPRSKRDVAMRQIASVSTPEQYQWASTYCHSIPENEKVVLQYECAWFFIRNKDPRWHDYRKGTSLAAYALQQESKLKTKRVYAETLACGYFALGQKDKALQVTKEHGLDKRTADFTAGRRCMN